MKKNMIIFCLFFIFLFKNSNSSNIQFKISEAELNNTINEIVRSEALAGSDDGKFASYWIEIKNADINCKTNGYPVINAEVYGKLIIDLKLFEISITGHGKFYADMRLYYDYVSRSVMAGIDNVNLYEWENSGWNMDFVTRLLLNFVPDFDLTGTLFEDDVMFSIDNVTFPWVEDFLVVQFDITPKETGKYPDLSVSKMTLSENPFKYGAPVRVHIEVKNNVETAKYNFNLRVFDGNPDKNNDGIVDSPLGNGVLELSKPCNIFKLNSGEIFKMDFSVTCYGKDEMKIYAFVDGDNIIDELNEKNNIKSISYNFIKNVCYISPCGNDLNGNGTKEHPWRNFEFAVAHAEEKIIALPGIYEEYSPILINPLYPSLEISTDKGPGYTIITGLNDFDYSVKFDGDYANSLIFRGFTLQGMDGMKKIIDCCNHSPVLKDLVIIDNNLHNNPLYSSCIYGENGVQIENCTISGNGKDMYGIWFKVYFQYEQPRIWNSIITTTGKGFGLFIGSKLAYIPQNDYNDIINLDDSDYSYDVSIDPRQIGIHSLNEDPIFRGILKPSERKNPIRFFLNQESPCIDSGDPSYNVPPRGGKFIDIGAFEYLTMSPSIARMLVDN